MTAKIVQALTFAPPFGDGMVLQRETAIMLRGTAPPEEVVAVRFLGQTYTARADANGAWAVEMEPQPAGGPFTLLAEAAGQSVTARDVYFGDVWLCGGQSNMELTMRRVKNRFPEDMTATNEAIRQFFVPQDTDFQGPRDTLSGGRWAALTAESVWDFSAVGYFFAKRIHASQRVPIGLLYAAAGGTPIQAWMRRETLPTDMLETADLYRDDPGLPARIQADDQERINAFHADHEARDEGLLGQWYNEILPDGDWAERELCAAWTEQEGLKQPGVVWFRKTVPVPGSMRGQPAKLFLGCIVDSDTAYVDGVQVGTTGYRYPPREYDFHMPDKDTITVTVRVSFHENPGEFVPGKPYNIVCNGAEIDMSGLWRYRRGAQFERLEPQTFINRTSTGLYNGMIAPLHRFPVKGILFYQGESNTGAPQDYDALFRTMIEDWRAQWKNPKLPFLYAQIANYKTPDFSENWPELRDRQRAALTLPDTAMIVTIDCGEDNDLHPTDKRTVGERLASAAERIAYGLPRPVEANPCRVSREGHSLIVHFPVKLKASAEPLEGFELCGPDGVFHPAQAHISGDTVTITHPSVVEPIAVRYAWSDAPKATLFSVTGDPSGSFSMTVS